MKINITEIPVEGKDVEFEVATASLNARVRVDREIHDASDEVLPPEYLFKDSPVARLHLNLEGRTVFVRGNVAGRFVTACSRCAEETIRAVDIPIEIVLKPIPAGGRPEDADEDVQFGFYDGKDVDCSLFTEDFIILSLPYVVFCTDNCRGLCPRCGKNLNTGPCGCPPEKSGDDRLAVLRGLKIQ